MCVRVDIKRNETENSLFSIKFQVEISKIEMLTLHCYVFLLLTKLKIIFIQVINYEAESINNVRFFQINNFINFNFAKCLTHKFTNCMTLKSVIFKISLKTF